MPEEHPTPLPGATPPVLPPNRPPVPGWMWPLFGLGLVPVGLFFCVATASSGQSIGSMGLAGAGVGLILGLPMLGGLAMSSRLFHDSGSRFVMGIIFAFVIMVGLAGIAFAGCMCLLSGQKFAP